MDFKDARSHFRMISAVFSNFVGISEIKLLQGQKLAIVNCKDNRITALTRQTVLCRDSTVHSTYTDTHTHMNRFGSLLKCHVYLNSVLLLLHPGRGAKYCDEYDCLFVCLSRKPHGRASPIFVHILSVSVARSSPDGVAICYVLRVFMPRGQWARIKHDVIGKKFARWRYQLDVKTTAVFGRVHQNAAPEAGGSEICCLRLTCRTCSDGLD